MIEHVVDIPLVNVTPQKIWNWLSTMNDEKYREWHHDHRYYKILHPVKKSVGMKVRFVEVLEGSYKIDLAWEVIQSIPPRHVIFRAIVPFPVRLELLIFAMPNGALVRHHIKIGNSSLLSRIFEPVISTLIFTKKRQSILERHAYEEFKNLEHLV